MYICSGNENVIFYNELPTRGKGQINRKNMVGMTLNGEYYKFKFVGLKILEYIGGKRPKFLIGYNNKFYNVSCADFINNGNLGRILDDYFNDFNNKYIDNHNIVHIFITNTKGDKYEALYSGNHVEEVMNSNWCVLLDDNKILSVQTKNYNKTKKQLKLHQVDLGSWVDHINNNPLDNRIENLRKSNPQDNNRNLSLNNKFDIVGISCNGKGYRSRFNYNKIRINTKAKHSLEEAKLDNLITQRYLGYKHNEDMFYLLDNLSEERIKEVTDLLDEKMKKVDGKIHEPKEYNHKIIDCGDYKKLIWKDKEMLFNCSEEFIGNMHINECDGYWRCIFVENGDKIRNQFHKELLGIKPNEYFEYGINIDHLNNDGNDNRYENLFITTYYSNQCNKQGLGYYKTKSDTYTVEYMNNYRFWNLISGIKRPTYKMEKEAIDEVNRRREIIENSRVKLKSKGELNELIQYCLDNRYLQDNGLADLDLGYLYWKGIL